MSSAPQNVPRSAPGCTSASRRQLTIDVVEASRNIWERILIFVVAGEGVFSPKSNDLPSRRARITRNLLGHARGTKGASDSDEATGNDPGSYSRRASRQSGKAPRRSSALAGEVDGKKNTAALFISRLSFCCPLIVCFSIALCVG